jgi:enoyl-CoA hydratase
MLDIPKNTEKSHADGKILQGVSEGVGVITFNNPEKRNAMSLEMWEGLGSALIDLRDNPDVRIVILVGAGDKAFVSGADISQFEKTRHNAAASEEYSRRSARCWRTTQSRRSPASAASVSAAACRSPC